MESATGAIRLPGQHEDISPEHVRLHRPERWMHVILLFAVQCTRGGGVRILRLGAAREFWNVLRGRARTNTSDQQIDACVAVMKAKRDGRRSTPILCQLFSQLSNGLAAIVANDRFGGAAGASFHRRPKSSRNVGPYAKCYRAGLHDGPYGHIEHNAGTSGWYTDNNR